MYIHNITLNLMLDVFKCMKSSPEVPRAIILLHAITEPPTVHDVMEITNGEPWQNSSQNSVFWRGAECQCQVAKFLLLKYKRMIKTYVYSLKYII